MSILGKTITVEIFAYQDYEGLSRLVPKILSWPIDQLIVSYGGDIQSKLFMDKIKHEKLIKLFEPQRLGKISAINRAMKFAEGEIVFQISADVDIEQDSLIKLIGSMDDETGVSVPRIVPIKISGFIKHAGKLIWDLEDCQKLFFQERGKNNHGGEVLCIKKSLIEEIPPETYSDDGFICTVVQKKGYKVRYERNAVSYNTPPGKLKDLLSQRRRTNLSKMKLKDLNLSENVLNNILISDPKSFILIIGVFIKNYPFDFPFS